MAEKLTPENKEKWICPLCHIECDDRFCAMCGISKEVAGQYDSLMEDGEAPDESNDITGDWPAVSASEQKNSLYRRKIREAERKAKEFGFEEKADDSEPEPEEPAPAEIPEDTAADTIQEPEIDAPQKHDAPPQVDTSEPPVVDISAELEKLATHKRVETPQIRLVRRTPYVPYRRPPRKDTSSPAKPRTAPSPAPTPSVPAPPEKEPALHEKQPTLLEEKPTLPEEKPNLLEEKPTLSAPPPQPRIEDEEDEEKADALLGSDIRAELDAITAQLTPKLDIDISDFSAFNDKGSDVSASEIKSKPDEAVGETGVKSDISAAFSSDIDDAGEFQPLAKPTETSVQAEDTDSDSAEEEAAIQDFIDEYDEYSEETDEEEFAQTAETDIDLFNAEKASAAADLISDTPSSAAPPSAVKVVPKKAAETGTAKRSAKKAPQQPEDNGDAEDKPGEVVYIETGSGAGLWKPAAIISILTSALLLLALVFVYVKYAVLEPRYGSEAVNTRIGLSDIFPEEETSEVTALTVEEPPAAEEVTIAPETEVPETEPAETTALPAEIPAETTTAPETLPGAETVPDENAEPEPETAPEAYDIDDEAANRG